MDTMRTTERNVEDEETMKEQGKVCSNTAAAAGDDGKVTLFGVDDDNDGDDNGSCTTYMYSIVESHKEFVHGMKDMESAWWQDEDEGYYEEFCRIVSTYQEQPHLLDSVLEELVGALSTILLDCIRRENVQTLNYVCRFLWKVSSVRGYKTIARCLPTDVYYVEPLFRFLSGKEKERHSWECEYCVLLWCYHLALVPFDFDVIDSESKDGGMPMVGTLVHICKERLYYASTVREMAAVCLGRLLTRPDMTRVLEEFGTWAQEVLECKDHFIVPGVLLTLATVLKIGTPTDETIKSLAMRFISRALGISAMFERNQLIRTLAIKIVQRAALVCIIGQDLELEESQEALGMSVDALLSGLSDRDTVVRWSSAKGIARVASKLDASFVQQMMETLLDMMKSPVASETVWHGGCLALAEMTRRNLVVGSVIPDLVPVIQKGLVYEVRRGYSSVGTNVRDAASYVCWALARTQTKEDMSVAFQHLAPVLMASACYDREINCRRAAAAAFQECVGRLGDVPYGIDILTIADFFSVSLRTASYLEVAPRVASFPGYHSVFAHHVLERTRVHWETSIRELAGKALAALVHIDVEFHTRVSLPLLIRECSSRIVEQRHGALVALARILPELVTQYGTDTHWLDSQTREEIASIIPNLVASGVMKGLGAEVMRGALCRLIWSIAHVEIPLSGPQLDCFYAVCRENLSHPSEDVQKDAADALSRVLDVYIKGGDESSSLKTSVIVDDFIQDLHPSLQYGARRGAALAFGKFPGWLIAQYPSIFEAIVTSLHIEDTSAVADVESRVYAIQALPHILESMRETCADKRQLLDKTFDSLLVALDDYSSDNRGDIGSWVREAAANSCVDILGVYYEGDMFSHSVVGKLSLCKIVRLSLERIGRVRQSAGKCLKRSLQVLHTFDLDNVSQAVDMISEDDFLDGKAVSGIVTCCSAGDGMLLQQVMMGAMYAIGGLDVTLQEFTSDHLVSFFEQAEEGVRTATMETIVSIWEGSMGSGRLAMPWIHTVDVLLSRTVCAEHNPFILKVIRCVETMIQGSGDVPKLCKLAELLGTIIGEDVGSPTNRSATSLLIRLMGKKYPKVRKTAAEQLYTAMLVWDEDDVPNLVQACALLEETSWQGAASIVRPAREQLTTLLAISLSY